MHFQCVNFLAQKFGRVNFLTNLKSDFLILTLLFLSLEVIIMDQVGYDRGSTTLLTSSGNMTVYIQYLCTFKVFTAQNISKNTIKNHGW